MNEIYFVVAIVLTFIVWLFHELRLIELQARIKKCEDKIWEE